MWWSARTHLCCHFYFLRRACSLWLDCPHILYSDGDFFSSSPETKKIMNTLVCVCVCVNIEQIDSRVCRLPSIHCGRATKLNCFLSLSLNRKRWSKDEGRINERRSFELNDQVNNFHGSWSCLCREAKNEREEYDKEALEWLKENLECLHMCVYVCFLSSVN